MKKTTITITTESVCEIEYETQEALERAKKDLVLRGQINFVSGSSFQVGKGFYRYTVTHSDAKIKEDV